MPTTDQVSLIVAVSAGMYIERITGVPLADRRGVSPSMTVHVQNSQLA